MVGIGCFVLMVGVVDYNDRNGDLNENLANVDFCNTLLGSQRESCQQNASVGLEYALDAVAKSYQIIALGSITIASGMTLFVTSYAHPSWFKRIAHETTNHDRTAMS